MKWNVFTKNSDDEESASDAPLDEKTLKKDWFEDLVNKAITRKESQETIRFTIEDIRIKGFEAKTGGLYAFVLFRCMPWQYPDRKMWETIFPIIVGNTFLGKIYKIRHQKRVYVFVDGNIPQFDELTLNVREDYTGIVVKKISNYVYVDIGYQFNWDYGSFVGLLHSSTFDSLEQFRKCELGQEIEVKYLGSNKLGKILLGKCDNPEEDPDDDLKEYRHLNDLPFDYEQ